MKGKGKREDLNKIVIGVAVAFMVLLGMAVYFMSGIPPTPEEIMLNIVVIVVVVLAFVLFSKRFKSYKSGLPAEDEMSKKTMQKAGYYAWFFAIYAAIISRFFGESVAERTGSYEIVGSYMTLAVVLGSALFFFLMYFYFSRKGDV